jgi:hypothetical protein
MWTRSPRSSTELRRLALVLALGICLAPAVARSQASGDIGRKARAILGKGYQTDLPERPVPRGEGGSDRDPRRPGSFGPPADGGALPAASSSGEALGPLIQLILGVLGAAALVLLVIWLIRNLSSTGVRSSRGRPGEVPPDALDRPEPERGSALADAERLAAQERWTEAVHTLLLIAIRHLSSRFSVPQASSRTSRELARLLPLQKEAREAFAGLVRTVEVSLFGGVPVGPDDYRTSLERVRRLLGGAA